MKNIYKVLAFLFIFQSVNASDLLDLSIVNIDKMGAQKLLSLKNNENVSWWVEMGSQMVIATNSEQSKKLPQNIQVIETKKNIDINNLAFQTLGHCDHSMDDDMLHDGLDAVVTNDAMQIINTRSFTDKTRLFQHDSIKPFVKNSVLSYQYNNRNNQKSGKAEYQYLVDQVSGDRWYSRVQYLATLDRMLHEDLVIAGQWLEAKFNKFNFDVSRVEMHNHRGFNVLGFKQGTSRADDWYVVGAHLDSRNQNWSDAQRSPGAEDNASGCAGVLEVANIVKNYESEASIIFMCFTAEEYGLFGSKDVVLQLTADGNIDKVKGMLNMDMISYRLGNRNIATAGTNRNESLPLANKVAGYGEEYSDIDWQVSGNMCCTDFVSFTAADIPAVTSNQPDIGTYFGYHSVDDLPENLDPVLGAGIIKANLATLAELAGVHQFPEFIFSNSFE